MLDKILKALLPITVIIAIWQMLSPNGTFSFLNSFSMILTCITIYSIGWLISSFLYNSSTQDYSLVRHIGLAAIFAVPVVAIIFVPSFLYPYIVGKGFVFRFLAIISLCSFVYLSFVDERYKLKVTPFLIGSTVFALAMLLATIFSMDPSRSFWSNYERMEGYINLISLFVLTISALSLHLKELEWNRFFSVHMWISTFVSGVAVFQYIIGILQLKFFANYPILSLCLSAGPACRVDSTLGNSIYLGIYSGLTFWLIIYAIFGKRIKGNLLPVLAGINLLAVYFSFTRSVEAGMLVGLVVLFVTKYWFDGNKKAVAGTIMSGLLFVILFGGFMIYASKNNIGQNIEIIQRFSSVNTIFARWEIWKTAVISWEQKPILGWGQENFIHAFNLNYNPEMYGQETYFDHPHNTYLGWLVFGGLVGFIAFLFMLATAVYGVIKSNLTNEKENDLIIPVLLALFTTYFVHIFFVFDSITSSLLFVLCAVYFGSEYSYGSLNIPTLHSKHKNTLGLFVIVVGVYLVYSTIYMPSYANLTTIDAMTYQQRSTSSNPIDILNGTKDTYEKAIAMNTFGNYEIREFYLQKALEFVNLLPQVKDDSVRNAIINVANDAETQFQTQVANNPYDHRARFMLGLYYLNVGRYSNNYDRAIKTLQDALALAPNKQIALTYLAKAYILKGDIDDASVYYQKAIDITPKNIPGYNQIRIEYIQVLMLANQDQKALEVIKDLLPTVTKDDFNTLVGQMTQVYTQRKDLKGIIKLLTDANNLDPQNQNFVLWLAQAYAASGDYNNAVFTINKLSTSDPQTVAQFEQQLQDYVKQQQATQTTATTTPATKKGSKK